ncbi:MAG: ferric reductase-like transmembrane domain-containing protein [Coriobacteriales bacterium]|nr:ferric reductase-like transmembrane domain-containing protein [Coriobacteriales bacterium]
MDASLLGFLIALAICAIIVIPLGDLLRKHPVPFYAVAVIATVLYVWAISSGVNLTAVRPLTVMMQRGYLASIMLAVVMFCGCFDEGTPIRKKLQPIRGELSILSFIFILAHLWSYLPNLLMHFDRYMSARGNIAFSTITALVLTVIFAVLAVMSLRVIRTNMNTRIWKNIQRFAYLMVLLLAVHIAFALGKSAFANPGSLAMLSFASYMVVIAVYAVLRILKYRRDSAKKQAS